jgi:hypothetical protein
MSFIFKLWRSNGVLLYCVYVQSAQQTMTANSMLVHSTQYNMAAHTMYVQPTQKKYSSR